MMFDVTFHPFPLVGTGSAVSLSVVLPHVSVLRYTQQHYGALNLQSEDLCPLWLAFSTDTLVGKMLKHIKNKNHLKT